MFTAMNLSLFQFLTSDKACLDILSSIFIFWKYDYSDDDVSFISIKFFCSTQERESRALVALW